jgi:hypothetical protein
MEFDCQHLFYSFRITKCSKIPITYDRVKRIYSAPKTLPNLPTKPCRECGFIECIKLIFYLSLDMLNEKIDRSLNNFAVTFSSYEYSFAVGFNDLPATGRFTEPR